MTRTPEYLNEGDKIGIISPAGIVKEADIEPAIRILMDWGLKVDKGKYLYEQHNFFAGTDSQRLEDFQNMLDNPELRAIFCSRGGYGIIKLIDKLNFTNFLKSPKWIVGYSDITILHLYLNLYLKCESIHALMPKKFLQAANDGLSLSMLHKALFGSGLKYTVGKNKLNKAGKVAAMLTGGNLSLIYSLQGTPFEINTRNKILFIEDTGEPVYHIDRMMMNLKISGKLKSLKGLIVGGMTNIRHTTPDYGKTAYEVIADIISGYDYPVTYGMKAGHNLPNLPLYMGRHTHMEVTAEKTIIEFKE